MLSCALVRTSTALSVMPKCVSFHFPNMTSASASKKRSLKELEAEVKELNSEIDERCNKIARLQKEIKAHPGTIANLIKECGLPSRLINELVDPGLLTVFDETSDYDNDGYRTWQGRVILHRDLFTLKALFVPGDGWVCDEITDKDWGDAKKPEQRWKRALAHSRGKIARALLYALWMHSRHYC